MRIAMGLVVLMGLGVAGCGETTVTEVMRVEPSEATEVAAPSPIDLASITLSADEVEQVNKLPEEERAAALAQKICPVGEDENGAPNHLGSMGMPIKVDLDGQVVYVCCAGCVADLKAEPGKFLSKLGAGKE